MSAPFQHLIISRDEYLYAALIDNRGIHLQQRLVNIARLTPRDIPCIWAVSPDGRHIAYTGVSDDPVQAEKDKIAPMPQTVYRAALPGATDKRLLFSTQKLRDDKGRKVEFSPFWPIHSLRWSRSGQRLYVSLDNLENTFRGHTTCAVDAHTGHAVTNTSGNWQEVLPTYNIDESVTGRLIGVGQGRTRDEQEVCNACSRYFPVYTVRGGGPPASLLPGTFTSLRKPPYAFADGCAISPDGHRVAVTCENFLWLTSPDTLRYTRVLALPKPSTFGGITWLSDDALLYGQSSEAGSYQDGLWRLSLTSGGKLAASPHLLLRGDVGFGSFLTT